MAKKTVERIDGAQLAKNEPEHRVPNPKQIEWEMRTFRDYIEQRVINGLIGVAPSLRMDMLLESAMFCAKQEILRRKSWPGFAYVTNDDQWNVQELNKLARQIVMKLCDLDQYRSTTQEDIEHHQAYTKEWLARYTNELTREGQGADAELRDYDLLHYKYLQRKRMSAEEKRKHTRGLERYQQIRQEVLMAIYPSAEEQKRFWGTRRSHSMDDDYTTFLDIYCFDDDARAAYDPEVRTGLTDEFIDILFPYDEFRDLVERVLDRDRFGSVMIPEYYPQNEQVLSPLRDFLHRVLEVPLPLHVGNEEMPGGTDWVQATYDLRNITVPFTSEELCAALIEYATRVVIPDHNRRVKRYLESQRTSGDK